MDGWMRQIEGAERCTYGHQGETIIYPHYHVAGYKSGFLFSFFWLDIRVCLPKQNNGGFTESIEQNKQIIIYGLPLQVSKNVIC